MSTIFTIAQSGSGVKVPLYANMLCRHGLITGATGTGKTVTLQCLAENFVQNGIPVFLSDVKGDLSGLAHAGAFNEKFVERLKKRGIPTPTPRANPVEFWDVLAEKGIPVRATVSDMGPLLIARLLKLNDTQTSILQLIFRIADEHGLLILDFKDLRSIVRFVADNVAELKKE